MASDLEGDDAGVETASRGRIEEQRDKHHGRKKASRKKKTRRMKGRK